MEVTCRLLAIDHLCTYCTDCEPVSRIKPTAVNQKWVADIKIHLEFAAKNTFVLLIMNIGQRCSSYSHRCKNKILLACSHKIN